MGLNVTIAGEEFETDPTGMLVAYVDPGQLWVFVVLLVLVGLEHHTTLDRLVAMSTGIGSVLEQKVDILGKAQKIRIGLMDTRGRFHKLVCTTVCVRPTFEKLLELIDTDVIFSRL